jgi:hypothetical protein
MTQAKKATHPSKKSTAATTEDYGAAVLDALRHMNSKSGMQALTSVKAPGGINPVIYSPHLALKSSQNLFNNPLLSRGA